MYQQRKIRPNYPPNVQDVARQLYIQGMRASDIARELPKRFPEMESWPTERTIRNWQKDWGADQSGPWVIEESGDPALLLPMLRTLIEETAGRVSSLTKAQAELMSCLGRSLPAMPVMGAYHWARAMIEAREAREPADSLLHYLAYRPWEDAGAAYRAAAEQGRLHVLRSFCPGDDAWLALKARRTHGSFSLAAVIAPMAPGSPIETARRPEQVGDARHVTSDDVILDAHSAVRAPARGPGR